MLRYLLLLFPCFFSFIFLSAQETGVTFKVTNADGVALSMATVTVINVPDTVNQQQKKLETAGLAGK
ncbi:MAG: hypothetical protein EOO07_31095 [Chitinophagaceae bacterium]|nr:MAG: hypothetical protein EOO07_31095 [Chitinophagaceae bacterium]